MRASPSNLTIIWALLINVPTILMAAAWFVMSVFATAIGSKPPTPSEYMAILWPAVAGSAVALLSLWTIFTANRTVGALLGAVGLLIIPIAFSAMMP